jgi:type VI secretion system secreted protein Hcp
MKTLFKTVFAVAAWVFCASASVSAQSLEVPMFFLKVDGIPGESIQPGYTDHIEVVSFKLGVEQRGVSDFGGGAGAGKSSFLPLRIFKYVDKASPLLFLACATGKHIKTVEFKARKTGSAPIEYLKIKMEDVLISSVNHESADQDGGNILLESVSLNFAKIEITYTPVDSNGTPGTPIKVGFDLKKNKLFVPAVQL